MPTAENTSEDPREGRNGSRKRHRVLFVDDEPHLLAALRRMLRPQRDRWEIFYAGSGTEALDLLAGQEIDAVVCDMRMPGMNGAEVLARVQSLYPSTARIVLSGQADVESILAVVRSAQQFLAKPCDAATLTGAVDRALEVQRMLTDPALRELIGAVASLPTLPGVYHELVAAIESNDVDVNEVGRILASDVATSAEVLKLVNSAFFGLPRQIASVQSAVSLLGLENIRALVLAGTVFRVSEALTWVDIQAMRSAAMRRAGIARRIANDESWPAPERDIAVLACMLRDVGGLVLAEGLPTAALELSESLRPHDWPLAPAHMAELEENAYGCTVGQASAYLLGLWGFAPAVVHTVATYPLRDPAPGSTPFEQLLLFASLWAEEASEELFPAPSEYLTAERLRIWTAGAQQVTA
jgi:HD-like signal output (HDOD) protein